VNDDVLERSALVSNCRMNRERDLAGTNGGAREIRLDSLDFSRWHPDRRYDLATTW
jgi:hypothetical protein